MVEKVFAYSLEPPLVEFEYLKRELGLIWVKLGEEELLAKLSDPSDGAEVIIVSDSILYERVVRASTPNSLIVVLLSDEVYSPHAYNLINNNDSISIVIRNYGFVPAPISLIVNELLRLTRVAGVDPRTHYYLCRTFARGIRTRIRMARWKTCNKEVEVLPLGYTSVFANYFSERLSIGPFESLFQKHPSIYREREIPISFMGTKGQIQRQLALRKLRKVPGAQVSVSESFNGVTGGEVGAPAYVEMLLKSVKVLCPPGYTNNESFRYYESLICGAIPEEERISIAQLGLNSFRANNGLNIEEKINLIDLQLSKCRELIRERIKP